MVLPARLAEAVAGQAARRGLSFSDLLADYAADGLRRDGAAELSGRSPEYQAGGRRLRLDEG